MDTPGEARILPSFDRASDRASGAATRQRVATTRSDRVDRSLRCSS
jgi:hypothetical protein